MGGPITLFLKYIFVAKQQTLRKTVRLSFFSKNDVGKISVSFFCECKKKKEAIERGKKLLAFAFF